MSKIVNPIIFKEFEIILPEDAKCLLYDRDMFVRWVKDLKSNNFSKTTGMYFNKDDLSYCTLGLLRRKSFITGKLENHSGHAKIVDVLRNDIIIKFSHGATYNLDAFLIEMNDYTDIDFEQIGWVLHLIDAELNGAPTQEITAKLKEFDVYHTDFDEPTE